MKVYSKSVVIILLLTGLYLFTRLVNLDQMPIFVDEAGFIVWAKRGLLDRHQLFASIVEDGKPPLHIWGMIPFLKLFPQNLLYGARIFSVVTGCIGAIGFYLLSKELFGKKTAYISIVLYIVSPFILLYDRLALTDSAVNAAGVWILFLSILLAKKRSFRIAVIFGIVCGLGLLLKSNVLLMVLLSAGAVILPLSIAKKNPERVKIVRSFFVWYCFSIGIAVLFYAVQLLAPLPNFFESIQAKNGSFILPLSEFFQYPLMLAPRNASHIFVTLFLMTGLLPFLLSILGFILLWEKKRFLFFYLFSCFIIPLILFTFLLQFYFARYILFVVPFIILMCGYFLSQVSSKKMQIIFFGGLMYCIAYFDYPILYDYRALHFTQMERFQYVEGIASGVGMKDIITIAREKSKEKPVILLSEGGFGIAGYMLEASLQLEDPMVVRGYWPLDKAKLIEYQQFLPDSHVYVIYAYRTDFPSDWPIRKLKEYKKPYPETYYTLHELTK